MTLLIIINILLDFALVVVLSVLLGLLCCYFLEWTAEAICNIIYRIKSNRK